MHRKQHWPVPASKQALANATMLRERFAKGMLKELQPHPHWIVWQRQGEQKVPYHPAAYYHASSTKPQTWGTLTEALTALTTGRFAGLGFMLHPTRIPLTFVDLDHIFGSKPGSSTDITDPTVLAIVQMLCSYTEISPSGRGVHILTYGELPGSGIHTDIEMYATGRYFTVTGEHLSGTPLTIEHRQERITRLYEAHRPPPVLVGQRSGPTFAEATAEARPHLTQLPPAAAADPVLQALLQGDLSRYGGDESRGDFVLLMKLLHWTGDDVALTKQLYLASPLGQREKVQAKRGPTTYLEMTIMNILRKRQNPPMKR